MTNEEMRVAIAEAVGCKRFKRPHDEKVFLSMYNPANWSTTTERIDAINSDVPDYPGDLNACHEAEKLLTGPETIIFERHLGQLMRRDLKTEPGDRYPKAATVCVWHATAAQRAEAFLRAIGKWNENTSKDKP